MAPSDDLDIALRISDLAADLALGHFHDGVGVTIKPDGSPVTEADTAVEQLLRDELARWRPDDAILGEEYGRTGVSERVWILDPIDGTSSFSRHQPHWRVHVALEVAGRIETAVVTAPAIGRQWWAAHRSGAFESSWPREGAGTRLAVSDNAEMGRARLGALDGAARVRLPREAIKAQAQSPAWCGGLIDLLRGDMDCFFAECCQVWDHAPWILLVEEAGGRFSDRNGGRSGHLAGGLYSNRALHDQLSSAVGYPQPLD